MAGVKIVIVNALPDNIQMIHQSDEATVPSLSQTVV